MLNHELTSLVEKELEPEEVLLWCSQPDRTYLFFKSIVNLKFCIGLLIIIICFAVFNSVLSSKYESYEASDIKYGILLIMVFIFFLIYPFRKFLKESRSIYAVTKQRCLLFKHNSSGLFRKYDEEFYHTIGLSRTEPIISFRYEYINDVICKARPDNTGDIFLLSDHELDMTFLKSAIESKVLKKKELSNLYGLIKKKLVNKIVFWGINDAKWVSQTIKDCMEKRKTSKT